MELSGALASMYALLKDVAPLPDDDDEAERLAVGRAWSELGGELRKTAKQIEPTAEHLTATNQGTDTDAFQAMWHGEEGPSRRLAAGATVADLTAAGTMAVVVLRAAWKLLVLYHLAVLAVALARALAAGPLGYFIWASRLVGVRLALRTLLLQARKHIGEVVIGTLVRAKGILTGPLFLIGPVYPAGLVLQYLTAYGLEPSDEEARRKTEELLAQTPMGREALAWAREHGVTVLFHKGEIGNLSEKTRTAGNYNDGLDVLRIGLTDQRSPEDLAETFVHEVNHARNQNTPDPLRMGRQEYIEAAIAEEVEGNVKKHEFAQQLAEIRNPGVTVLDTYRSAYENAINKETQNRILAKQPPLTGGEEHRIGDQAARAALREECIAAGYEKNYGTEWDRRQLLLLNPDNW
ncbi:hypothetical protein AB0395_26010 [Streptosporangium sp. NPDC051023]|uniref:hypothetical protein n=1 Tax=Streptosporangium sp. NPDC051023 TaxID=3155410 RepID=UPI00344EB452